MHRQKLFRSFQFNYNAVRHKQIKSIGAFVRKTFILGIHRKFPNKAEPVDILQQSRPSAE